MPSTVTILSRSRGAVLSGYSHKVVTLLMEFESPPHPNHADIAQMAEQAPCKRQVAGSMPAVGTI